VTFTSPSFLLFLFASFALYWALPMRWRWPVLLGAGYLLYLSTGPAYFPVLVFVTLTTYASGRILAAHGRARTADASGLPEAPAAMRWPLALALTVGLAPLALFKYTGFVTGSLASAAHWLGVAPSAAAGLASLGERSHTLLLPLGISFYTFKALSYLIEVARDPARVERHLGRYALSISFFPQIFAGPIERPHALLAQIEQGRQFDRVRASEGLNQLAVGLFKKLVIADRLAPLVNQVYGDLNAHTGLPLLLALFGFSLQIYFDFAGYSDIANGTARLFGFDGMENFRRPYFARSFREFWHRWHISLSTWFRDYLYFPLGGNRVGPSRHAINVLATFVISGLWHGAAWTFAFWGAMHGGFLIGEMYLSRATDRVRARRRTLPSLPRPVWSVLVFTLTSVAWVFFRAPTLDDAFFLLGHVATGIAGQLSSLDALAGTLSTMGLTAKSGLVLGVSLTGVLIAEIMQERGQWGSFWSARPGWQRAAAMYALVGSILLVGAFGQNSFLYFQF